MANLINIFNPEMIVIGGGLSNMGDRLFKPAHKVVEERAFNRAYRTVRFVRAALGRNSGVLGAAAFAFDRNEEGSHWLTARTRIRAGIPAHAEKSW